MNMCSIKMRFINLVFVLALLAKLYTHVVLHGVRKFIALTYMTDTGIIAMIAIGGLHILVHVGRLIILMILFVIISRNE